VQEVSGYLCPVCGYDKMKTPPEDYNICPSCGTEFGYEDFADTYQERQERWEELRFRWLSRGAPWFSPVTRAPANWNPYRQAISVAYHLRTESGHTSGVPVSMPKPHFLRLEPAFA